MKTILKRDKHHHNGSFGPKEDYNISPSTSDGQDTHGEAAVHKPKSNNILKKVIRSAKKSNKGPSPSRLSMNSDVDTSALEAIVKHYPLKISSESNESFQNGHQSHEIDETASSTTLTTPNPEDAEFEKWMELNFNNNLLISNRNIDFDMKQMYRVSSRNSMSSSTVSTLASLSSSPSPSSSPINDIASRRGSLPNGHGINQTSSNHSLWLHSLSAMAHHHLLHSTHSNNIQNQHQISNEVTFYSLPPEMKMLIFNYLDAQSLSNASCVCREWRGLMQEKNLWKGKRKALVARKIHNNYIESSDGSVVRNSYRIVLVGAGGVGKSSLTVRFVVGRFVEKYDPTIEDAYRIQAEIDDQPTNLDIIDTAGPEEYSALRDQYIKLGAGFIIVYSVTSAHSFHAVPKLRKAIMRIKGVAEEDRSCYNVPIILVGNKLDLEKERMVTSEEGQALANKYSNFSKNFFEVSARSNTNVSEIFYEIVRQIDTVEWRRRHQSLKRKNAKYEKCVIM